MKVHFIAIGGSAMHNLAIALHKKGYQVTGSDDEIFEPSKSRLDRHGLLPAMHGWFPENITTDIDEVILGMHAREDNPELIRARDLGLKIYSYPEYLYEQTKKKKRVVIGGSHGKTSITSMILHVLNHHSINCDYMVGAQLEGFDTMVRLSHDAEIAVFEGDEYLSSPIDRRPKFHLYKPDIALLSGIAWDHINVFPTFDIYVDQFRIFIDKIEPGGDLIYCEADPNLVSLAKEAKNTISCKGYNIPEHITRNGRTYLLTPYGEVSLLIFGDHNLQNLTGARLVCNSIGVSDQMFYEAISSFSGASKRLQLLEESEETKVFLDFAHSPSKLKATIEAVKKQFPQKHLVACMELHTFSSLNSKFLEQYDGSMNKADSAFVYFNPKTVEHKKLESIQPEQVKEAFNRSDLSVFTESETIYNTLLNRNWKNSVLLLMSSGNFDGIDYKEFAKKIISA